MIHPETGDLGFFKDWQKTRWFSYDEAQSWVSRVVDEDGRYIASGVGVSFAASVLITSDIYLTCIDIDSCIVDNEIPLKTQELLDSIGGAIELSPSGNGLHVWGFSAQRQNRTIKYRGHDLEIKVTSGWCTMTEKWLAGAFGPLTLEHLFEERIIKGTSRQTDFLMSRRGGRHNSLVAFLFELKNKLLAEAQTTDISVIRGSYFEAAFKVVKSHFDFETQKEEWAKTINNVFGSYVKEELVQDLAVGLRPAFEPIEEESETRQVENGTTCRQDETEAGEDETKTSKSRHSIYLDLVLANFGPVKKDIFDGTCYVPNPDPSLEALPLLSTTVENVIKHKINVLKTGTGKIKGLSPAAVVPALTHYETIVKKAELLINFEEWDGRDRVKEMASCLNVRKGFSVEAVDYFLKDWLIKVFARIEKPRVQNRVILFQGEGGIGKDEFFKVLCGGFGRYFVTPSTPTLMTASEQFFAERVYNKAIALFDEFDRLRGMEAIFKALVTREYFTIRLPYEKRAQAYPHRCNYVATCNRKDALTDATGNRRFLLFELLGGAKVGIRWDYEPTEAASRQIAAQAHEMFLSGDWQESGEFEAQMKEFVNERTPKPVEDDILDSFEDLLFALPTKRAFYVPSEYDHLLDRVARESQQPVKYVRKVLESEGVIRRKVVGKQKYRFAGLRAAWAQKDIEVELEKAIRGEEFERDVF